VELGAADADPVFAKYGISLALIPSDGPLANELRHEAVWEEAYHDKLASVFVHR